MSQTMCNERRLTFFVVTGSVASQFEDFSRKVFKDGSKIN